MFEIEGVRTSNQDVTSLLAQIRKDPRTKNPRVLAIHQIEHMRTKNGGYPVDMHHADLASVTVRNEDEEAAVSERGFQRQFIFKHYPKHMFRRNMHPKFAKSRDELARIAGLTPEAQKVERATVGENDFIEERIVPDAAAEKKLLAEAPTKFQGKWFAKITDIEPIKQGPEEDPEVTIARLKGELAGMEKRSGKAAA